MLTDKQKKILEEKIYEIVKNRINEWGEKSSGGKGKQREKDLGLVSKTKKNTVLNKLDDETVNKAAVAYKTYGAEDSSDDDKAAARSLFYKKLHNKKNDNGVPYEFSPEEINDIASILGDETN